MANMKVLFPTVQSSLQWWGGRGMGRMQPSSSVRSGRCLLDRGKALCPLDEKRHTWFTCLPSLFVSWGDYWCMAGAAASDKMMSQGWSRRTKDGNLERENIQVLRWYFWLTEPKQITTYLQIFNHGGHGQLTFSVTCLTNIYYLLL